MKTTKEFKKLLENLDLLKDEIISEIEEMKDLREEKFDERSEKWQEGEKGQEFECLTDELDSQMSEVECALDESLDFMRAIEDME